MKQVLALLGIVTASCGGWATTAAFAQCGCGAGQPQLVAMAAEKTDARASAAATAQPAPKEKEEVFIGNAKCPIMGGKTNPKLFVAYNNPKTHTYARIYLCCPGCTQKVKSDPAAAYKKAYLDRELKDKDGKVLAKKGEPQDLKNANCPVMGGKVSGQNFLVYNGNKVGLCCPDCEQKIVSAPDKYLAKLIQPRKDSAAQPAKDDAPAESPNAQAAPPQAPASAPHQH